MYIETVHSTNSWLREHIEGIEDNYLWTTYQTAGRGQAGNSWESEAGKNILLSYAVKQPPISVRQSFRLTMAVSIAIRETLQHILTNKEVTIKWPNDIYVDDCKLCGILIENAFVGTNIDYAIIGIGLNVNQTQWANDVPNPISLKQLTSETYELAPLVTALVTALEKEMSNLQENNKSRYMRYLYRREGKWRFAEREVNTIPTQIIKGNIANAFEAEIADITEQGELVLELSVPKQQRRTYHFKQIQYIL